jgi:hypothetical protein
MVVRLRQSQRALSVMAPVYSAAMMKRLVLLLWVLAVAGCTSLLSPAERWQRADALAAAQGWVGWVLDAPRLPLLAYGPAQITPSAHVTIYIEGDGLAWLSASQASFDPTPLNPLALRLALAQPAGSAVYLARPCQYLNARSAGCSSALWTQSRFSAEVVAATQAAIEQIKQRFGARQLTLVGYSGGAAVAALVAAERQDVVQLVSVAGNLDHAEWTRYHRISPLTGSLNPVDHLEALRRVPQWHLVGAQDKVIAPALVQAFAEKFPLAQRPLVVVEPGFDHQCCWAEQWPALWQRRQLSIQE